MFSIPSVYGPRVVARMFFIPDPKLKAQFLTSIAERDLIDPRRMAGDELEVNSALCVDG